jgi:antibiotic biosynthesis monooxygenase (ABM) superfamily enzyme
MSVYLTQLIYIQPGQEEVFDAFEAVAVPLLMKYRGELLLRVRPNPESVIETTIEIPYEIHVVRFDNDEYLKRFSEDAERHRVLHLKNQSVRDTISIRGTTSDSEHECSARYHKSVSGARR